MLPKARVKAKVEILLKGTKDFKNILKDYSGKSDLVFLGLGHSKPGEEKKTAASVDELTKDLKASILVQNNGMPGTVPILLNIKGKA